MCGNLGFIICDEVVDAAKVVSSMGQITSMRGAQSFGFAASSREGGVCVFKAVARKRSDIGTTMNGKINGVFRKKKHDVLTVLGHLRFATTSKSEKHEAHPHSWLGPQKAETLLPGKKSSATCSREVLITHNGDFEAFDVGKCFGKQSCILPLSAVRDWLTARLGTSPRSMGDSINVAGFIELLFAQGDPHAAARLAMAALTVSTVAPGIELVAEVGAALLKALLSNDDDDDEPVIQKVVDALAPLRLEAAVARDVALAALNSFRFADLRSATLRFLRHAKGAFGLAVCSSLAPCSLVIASVKQPMCAGVGPGFFAYASERAALHVGVVGRSLERRRVLQDGEVICVSVASTSAAAACCFTISSASIHGPEFGPVPPFQDLEPHLDFDCMVDNPRMMTGVSVAAPGADVVGEDLRDTPKVLSAIKDTFRGPYAVKGDNRATALAFARLLLVPERESRRLDLVIIGVEASLWLAEQWATDLRKVCPVLRIVVTSANKALASLTSCFNKSTCGTTRGFTVFPSGQTATESVRGAVALCVTHSGQTFPTLNAAVALQKAGAVVFGVSGTTDTALASLLGQGFGKGAPPCDRIFSTGAGIRLAEAASLTTLATHVLLTEVLFVVARHDAESALCRAEVFEVEQLQDASLRTNVAVICSGEHCGAEARRLGRKWAQHVSEPAVCFVAAVTYIMVTVTLGQPLLSAVCRGAIGTNEGAWWWYLIRFADALLYAFFTVVWGLGMRLVQGRTLLARFGKRNILILDTPQIHQCCVAFTQKLFALSFALNSVEVSGAFPCDHAVHKCLHRVVEGTLVALGLPDGRLRALVDAECAASLTAAQLSSISNWGVGPEILTVGHHSYDHSSVAANGGAVIFEKGAFERATLLHRLSVGARDSSSAEARRVSYQTKQEQSRRLLGGELSPTTKDALPLLRTISETTMAEELSTEEEEQQQGRPRAVLERALTKEKEEEPYFSPSSQKSITNTAALLLTKKKKEEHEAAPEAAHPGGHHIACHIVSHALVEHLYEGRVATLERQLAMYVLFHAMATRVSRTLGPFLSFDTWRSQAGTRVATTPSPTSPSADPYPYHHCAPQAARVVTTPHVEPDSPLRARRGFFGRRRRSPGGASTKVIDTSASIHDASSADVTLDPALDAKNMPLEGRKQRCSSF